MPEAMSILKRCHYQPCQYRRQDTYLFAVTLMPQLFMQLLKSKVLRCFLV